MEVCNCKENNRQIQKEHINNLNSNTMTTEIKRAKNKNMGKIISDQVLMWSQSNSWREIMHSNA